MTIEQCAACAASVAPDQTEEGEYIGGRGFYCGSCIKAGRHVVRRIEIQVVDGNTFNVVEGDRMADSLCWDEMLGQVAELTHPKIASARYRMMTPDERAEYRRRFERRLPNPAAAPGSAPLLLTSEAQA